jgi:FERM, RhoGEF and pleckstrin domain protein 2
VKFLNISSILILTLDYHGINGNVSLDRRSDIVQSPNRYDLTLGSDKSSTSRDGKTTTYDVVEAERNNQQNIINNNHAMLNSPTSNGSTQTNGNHHSTLERNGETHKRKWPADKAYFLTKEILMTERTYKRDLDVINSVSLERVCCSFDSF